MGGGWTLFVCLYKMSLRMDFAKKHREAAIGAQGDQVEANDDISNNEWKQRNSPKSSGGRRTRSRGRDGS